MSHNNKSRNDNAYLGFNGPLPFPDRPTFREGNNNTHLQNPRNPQVGPPPHQQFHNYPNMQDKPSINFTSDRYTPGHLHFQNAPTQQPPLTQSNQPPLHPQPPIPFSNPPNPQPSRIISNPSKQPFSYPQHQQPSMPFPNPQPLPPFCNPLNPQSSRTLTNHPQPSVPLSSPQPSIPYLNPPPPWQPMTFSNQQQPEPPSFNPQHLQPPIPYSNNSQSPNTFPNPPPPRPPMSLSNRPPFQGLSTPPPNPGAGIPVQQFPPGFAQHPAQNIDTRYGRPPFPPQSSVHPRHTHPTFPNNPPHYFSVDHHQSSRAGYNTVKQHKETYDSQNRREGSGQPLDDKEIGAQKLERWLQKSGKTKRPHLKDCTKQKLSQQLWKSISDLKSLTQLIPVISDTLQEMANCTSTASDASWESMTSNIEMLKSKLISLDFVLERPNVQKLEKNLLMKHRRRTRLKQARISKYEEDQRLKESWIETSQQIDKWQECNIAKSKEELKRKSKKAAADRTLSKVSREIQDASRLIDTMLALQKLRLIRRDAAQKRGDTDLGESRQTFDQKIDDMTRLVQSQLECYREEEAKLKQVIKSEQDEDTKKERLLQLEKIRQKQKEDDDELRTILFGCQGSIPESDPLYPYVQFYSQAENNLQAFVQIRHEWDSFLVPEDTPTSSVIPSSWIYPEVPSSTVWASALK